MVQQNCFQICIQQNFRSFSKIVFSVYTEHNRSEKKIILLNYQNNYIERSDQNINIFAALLVIYS